MAADDKARTLSDAEISSQRSVSRRSLLGTLELGVAAQRDASITAVPGLTQLRPLEPRPNWYAPTSARPGPHLPSLAR
jgi:hypothetical protein